MKIFRFWTAATALAYIMIVLSVFSCTNTSANDITGPSLASVTVTGVQLSACSYSPRGPGGYFNCQGTVTLTVNSPLSSGFVAVFMSYPDAGSFFHGQKQVLSTGTYTVNVVNDFMSRCVTSVSTTVRVYDGTSESAPQLVSAPITLTRGC